MNDDGNRTEKMMKVNDSLEFFDQLMYGGDYNPDQWDESLWEDDFEKLVELKVNVITLPVFSWAKLQPSEEVYNFEWLDRIVKMAAQRGIAVNMATPTAAQPAWMSKKYPDILPVDVYGIKRAHGGRSNFCPNSKSYRRLSRGIAKAMAERYKEYDNIVLWHVNNEYGSHCYCENCRQSFIEWLKDKYKTLDRLNEVWYTSFWSHTYYDWDEIQTVSARSELLMGRLGDRNGTNFQGMAIDYNRFMSDSIMACYKNEADVIKAIKPNIPITTNIWGLAPWLDLHKVGDNVDVVSWDCYPSNEDHYSMSAFKHDIIRSLKKDRPFILMEQTPNQQNWQDYNSLKRPGVMRLLSYQTVAHGGDGVLFFQVRQSKGACEKYHAALIPHAGHLETRIGRELKQLGRELKHISDKIVGAKTKAKVAMIMDWDNWWSVEYSSGPSIGLKYFETLQSYYKVLNKMNVSVDVVKPTSELAEYDLVLAPLMNMVSGEAKRNIESYVMEGGTIVATYFTGYVDENDHVYLGGYPGAFRELFGIWVEEVDALYKGQTNKIIVVEDDKLTTSYSCSMICEVIHTEGAKTLAKYEKDFYSGMSAVTENKYGKGKAYYIGTAPEESYLQELFTNILDEKEIAYYDFDCDNIEMTIRHQDQKAYYFVLNHNSTSVTIEAPVDGINLLTGEAVKASITIDGKGVAIIEKL